MAQTNNNNYKVKKIVEEYTDTLDMGFVNEIIEASGELNDFEMNKTTLLNIAEWALNGSSNDEIRKKLTLTERQWKILVATCPTLLCVMRDSRVLADTIVAGSLFQVAIGGKKIRKTVAKSVTEYDENGRPCGQHLETIELWEEMPPNVDALKFLATHKLSEKFGNDKSKPDDEMRRFVDNFTPEQLAVIEQARKSEKALNEEDK